MREMKMARVLSSAALPLFLLLSLHLQPIPRTSAASDTLKLRQSISGNGSLISNDGTYELRFFSPTHSTTNTYLGILYKAQPDNHPIWVANRERPILSRPGNVTLFDSSINLTDSRGTVLWSVVWPSPGLTVTAILEIYGNLDLRGGDGPILWQSNDHPTDTIISRTILWSNLASKTSGTLTSWTSDIDPSPGNVTFKIDPNNSAQFLMSRGSAPYWRSNVWGGASSGEIAMGNITLLLNVQQNASWVNVTFDFSVSTPTVNLRLNHTGRLELLEWDQRSNDWSVAYYIPAMPCEVYGYCGPFGFCDGSLEPATCKCLDGFIPMDKNAWEGGNYGGGCSRESFVCDDKMDHFRRLENMKLPDRFVWMEDVNVTACEEACRRNCSCMAYAYLNQASSPNSWIVLPSGSSRCLMWVDQLIDLAQQNGIKGGDDLYLRIPSSRKDTSRVRTIIALTSVSGMIFLIVLVYLIWKSKKHWKERNERTVEKIVEDGKDMSGAQGFSVLDQQKNLEFPSLDFQILVAVTDNFSDSCKIGQGGFGNVYKGTFPEGQEVAIKRLSKVSGQGLREFKNEVVLIAQLQHRNLVKLLGCCIKGVERLLIYEYMPNKSLDFFLFGDLEKKMFLDWERRFIIIKGIARGLRYLHEDSRLTIIHRDLKAGNVLLDVNMNPKISDFGMARIFDRNMNQANTARIAGTYGYMSPEYAMEGIFSVKSDVYSFGVLLLEIVSGHRNSGFVYGHKYFSLVSFTWEMWNNGNLHDIIDPSLGNSYAKHEVARCLQVGLLCVQDRTKDRLSMSSVVFMLENSSPIDAAPKKPTYTPRTKHFQSDGSGQNREIGSLNTMSLSTVECR